MTFPAKTFLRLLAFICLAVVQPRTLHGQCGLHPPGAPAPTMRTLAQIEPRTPGASAPFTITTSGSYCLTTALSVAAGDAITISAGDGRSPNTCGQILGAPGNNFTTYSPWANSRF